MNRHVNSLVWAVWAAAAAALSCTVSAADTGKKSQPALNSVTPDATICSVSAIDRTVPFTVGDKVRSPFRVVFAVSGMGVAPVAAGNIEGTGHHHILIDLDLPLDIKQPVPFDKTDEFQHQHYKHFGKGETETVLNLPPGKHKLRLMFANYQHIPYYIASKELTIEVLPSEK